MLNDFVIIQYRGRDIVQDGEIYCTEIKGKVFRYLTLEEAKTDIDIYLDY